MMWKKIATQCCSFLLAWSASRAFVFHGVSSREGQKFVGDATFRSGVTSQSVVLKQQKAADTAPEGSLVLIEVTKKNANVFKSISKGTEPETIEPVDEWHVHELSNHEHRSQGQGKHHADKSDPITNPEYLIKFYTDELMDVVDNADSVLLVGHGHGKSNLAQGLAAALCERQPAMTDKIADVLRLDGKHITRNQLLALGRRHLLHEEDPRKPT